MNKLRLGLIFGGRSAEHEVSLRSARSVLKAINRDKYEMTLIGISKEGRWLAGADPLAALAAGSGEAAAAPEAMLSAEPGKRELLTVTANGSARSLKLSFITELDVVFPLLHGPFGEDGTLQGLLELADLPYVGAGVLASAVGMDKATMKAVFRAHGLPVVPHVVVRAHEWDADHDTIARYVATELGYPCFVKPSNLGSSVGISKVPAPEHLDAAVHAALAHDRKILIERGIVGREIEVSVLGNDRPDASVPGEGLP